jgi:hypothetical protein
MPLGDAGIGTAGRLAEGDERRRMIGCTRVLEAERGRGIEEAIGQDADMQCAGKTREQRYGAVRSSPPSAGLRP